ncbi:hypothetical protein EMIT0194P_130089 [Pseudomonas serbica]
MQSVSRANSPRWRNSASVSGISWLIAGSSELTGNRSLCVNAGMYLLYLLSTRHCRQQAIHDLWLQVLINQGVDQAGTTGPIRTLQ